MANTTKAIVLNDSDLERPPYMGIGQWATLKKVAEEVGMNNSSRGPYAGSVTSSASESTQEPLQQKASACFHVPMTVAVKIPPDPVFNGLDHQIYCQMAVCKDGAYPTQYCGRYSRELEDPPIKGHGSGQLKCPRCGVGYGRRDALKRHFETCIARNGNPDCLAWTDDDSYDNGATAFQTKRTTVVRTTHLTTVSGIEFAIRTAMRRERYWHSTGATEEDEYKDWVAIKIDLMEYLRNSQEDFAETEALIAMFREEGLWDSEASDEA